jgi:hypothetical protein
LWAVDRTDAGGEMVTRIFAQHHEAQAFHWIGAATVTLWSTLPHDVQEAIVQRALAMGDADDGAQIRAFTGQQSQNETERP